MKVLNFRRMAFLAAMSVLLVGVNVAWAQTWDIGVDANIADVKATFSGGTLTISGTGQMQEFDEAAPPWDGVKESIINVIVREGVTNIGGKAFSGYESLVSVTIGKSVAIIGDSAFADCTALDTIICLTLAPPTIQEHTFSGVKATVLYVPKSSIGGYEAVNYWNEGFTISSASAVGYPTVTFNSQSDSEVSPQTVERGGNAAEPTDPTRAGYIFDSWYREGAFTNKWNFDNDEVTIDTTLYAKWIPSYKVTFDANGGEALDPEFDETDFDGKIGTLPTPTRAGYTFNGWFTAETGGDEVDESTVFDSDATIYAQWSLKPYRVTFDANGGEALSPDFGETGADGKLDSLPMPTRTDHIFIAWFTDKTDGDTVKVSKVYGANDTIYARWKQIYKVTFDANGGDKVSPDFGETNIDGKLDSLPMPTRTDHTFIAWFTDKTGGDTVKVSKVYGANDTIYARWIQIYKVTFNPTGGDVSPTAGLTDTSGKLDSLPTPTKDDHIFTGWFFASTGGTAITKDMVYNSDTTIHARWVQIYTITFDANGGTVNTAPGKTGLDSTLTSLPTPTKPGHIFDGWFTDTTDGEKVTLSKVYSANDTIYAQWTYTEFIVITFDPTGGSVDPTSGLADSSSGKLDSLPTPIRAGYTFDGWFTDSTGGVEVTNNTVFDKEATIYARWTPIRYTVTFNPTGGIVSPESRLADTSGKLDSLPTPTRTGHIFTDWFTDSTAGDKVTLDKVYNANDTIYARWIRIYTITFNANGGIVTPASGETSADSTLASLPTPTKGGHIFDGWFTDTTDGEKVTLSKVYGANDTIYAQWTATEFIVVTFDPTGGTVAPTSGLADSSSGKLDSLPTPTRAGYTFDGWFTADTGGVAVTIDRVYSEDTVIYAQWTVIASYSVTFGAGAHGTLTATVDGDTIVSGALVQQGKSVIFTATPSEGYKVSDWMLNGSMVTGNADSVSYTLTSITANAVVTVSFEQTTSVAEINRIIPPTASEAEASVIAPITITSGEFTAGPNPVSRQFGAVTFYWQGKRIENGVLTVYDISGNAIGKVNIRDNAALGGNNRRVVGAWDLTDSRGRPVADGTYLVRGTLKTGYDSKERVSLIIGVR